ncbi:isocitrate/isopropylmalate family dehydrogenase [Streptomyces fuscigenes]|uniref:isocitrate/isopropylmalate family dehydrogenase n=1 Tax=Streptomyces fuscigenes TaxID=1528880 RepID=UPI001F4503ED|nr:isocitrate/isopropylmalate family dehydrogenase [Streptomyces fuscigenes]MCF3961861.1 isocitrate/isopropylmalate family dehydrogenase [Streptomyces fuscigenes]
MTVHDVALIRGDGIGPELVDAALTVLAKVSDLYGFDIGITEVDAGAGAYERTGEVLDAAGRAAVGAADAVLTGPVGLPSVRLPDGTTAGRLEGILHAELGLHTRLRPVELLPGVPSRLDARPGSVDYVVVRDIAAPRYVPGGAAGSDGDGRGGGDGNSRGNGAGRGRGGADERRGVQVDEVSDTLTVAREDCVRTVRRAFELARSRSGSRRDRVRRVTCADRADTLRGMRLLREVFLDVAGDYPEIRAECLYADAAAEALVTAPEYFDVIVTADPVGGVLSALGAGTVGGAALCPSGAVGDAAGCFGPVTGSAPSLAGRRRANPVGQILAAAMMLDHLGEPAAARSVREAVRGALDMGTVRVERDGRSDCGAAAAAEAIAREVQPGA